MKHDSNSYPVTIVTAYYRFKKSKYSHSTYIRWIKNFLCNMPHPLVIFTDAEHAPYFIRLRKKHRKNTLVIIKEFQQLNESKRFAMWEKQREKDAEKAIRGPELYIIWNEKIHFINEANKLNPYRSNWFVWMDIGAFRNGKYDYDLTPKEIAQWPDLEKIKNLPKEKFIAAICDEEFSLQNYVHDDVALLTLRTKDGVGGLYIVHDSIISKIHSLYFALVKKRENNGLFVGSDQDIFTCLAIAHPEYFHLLEYIEYISPWFYIHHYLLSDTLLEKKFKLSAYQKFKNYIKKILGLPQEEPTKHFDSSFY